MRRPIDDADRCQATVHKRDTYRRTGRGKSGFAVHYRQDRCRRRAVKDGCCYQHKLDQVDLYRIDD